MDKEQQMQFHIMQANWWMHSATNGHATTRNICHGADGPKLTTEELRDNAMEISQQHISLYKELAESCRN